MPASARIAKVIVRTLIYARFSSDLQNDRSIDDQIADCRARATREGWTVIDVFTDYAISGGAGLDESQRPGMNALIARVAAGGVDQLLADTSSRVARDLGDSDRLRKLLAYHGARLFTLADGELDAFKGTIKGLFDEQQRTDTAHNIRRGQRGRALAGMNPGGIAYGYRKVGKLDGRGEPVRGLRVVDEDQAAVIRRIYDDYAAGRSARAIAERLNAERVPAPTGGLWRASTIHGDARRKNGILQNELYRGKLTYNRTRRVYHPVTRRREVRVNPASEWIIVDAPDLRIVSEAQWRSAVAVRERFSGRGPGPAKRPKRLLSGKGVCTMCGGSWIVVGDGRWGCGRHQDGRGCGNGRTITTDVFERRVLQGLSERLLDPELVAAYVEEWQAARTERLASSRKDRGRLLRRKADAEKRIARYVEALGSGKLGLDEVAAAIAEAKAERDRCDSELREVAAEKVVALHPGLASQYRRRIADLRVALAGDDALEARNAIRGLIDRIDVSPAEGRGVNLEVHGLLAGILEVATGKPSDCMVARVPLGRVGRSSTLLQIAC